jgi:hypothetical protein
MRPASQNAAQAAADADASVIARMMMPTQSRVSDQRTPRMISSMRSSKDPFALL